jgi:hypothetical protein
MWPEPGEIVPVEMPGGESVAATVTGVDPAANPPIRAIEVPR